MPVSASKPSFNLFTYILRKLIKKAVFFTIRNFVEYVRWPVLSHSDGWDRGIVCLSIVGFLLSYACSKKLVRPEFCLLNRFPYNTRDTKETV